MLKTLRIFLLTAWLTFLSWYYLEQYAYKVADWVFSKFPVHQLQLKTTFDVWIPVLAALFFTVLIESLIQAIQTRKYPWQLYWIFVYMGILIGFGHLILFFIIRPEQDHGGFDGAEWEFYSYYYLIVVALSTLGFYFKKKPAPRYEFFLVTNAAVIITTLLCILFF